MSKVGIVMNRMRRKGTEENRYGDESLGDELNRHSQALTRIGEAKTGSVMIWKGVIKWKNHAQIAILKNTAHGAIPTNTWFATTGDRTWITQNVLIKNNTICDKME